MSQDKLYSNPIKNVKDFAFDKKVAKVFTDMISRSVPGYDLTISMASVVANLYSQDNSFCYDLGCSLGAFTIAMRRGIDKPECNIIAVDNASEMIKKCKRHIKTEKSKIPVHLVCSDICDIKILNASIVVMNFTLQFIEVKKRIQLLKKIYKGLLPGGVLIISEKITFKDKKQKQIFDNLHHAFKESKGYSKLEIEQKRTALENVLVAETSDNHIKRLKEAGFKKPNIWFQCFNFISIIAQKGHCSTDLIG